MESLSDMHIQIFSLIVAVSFAFATSPEAVFAQQGEGGVKVMSFNIRYGTAKDGVNHWEKRKEFVVETIKKFDPDVLGTQETLDFQRDYLSENLKGYSVFGVGRNDGKEDGEMMAIYYRDDRFTKLEGGHSWYSETPEVAGSMGWDTSLPRMVSWVKLKSKSEAGQEYYFFNTHFDHIGPQAKKEAAKLLVKWIAEKHADGTPVIFMGDFNSMVGSQPYKTLFESESIKLQDTYLVKHPSGSEPEQTYGGFEAVKTGKGRIDWMGCTEDIEVIRAEIDRTARGEFSPSDHYPINAVLGIKR
ncbi:endonuclease/exonuclease/phosphatase family protein [Lacunimicrobium album]